MGVLAFGEALPFLDKPVPYSHDRCGVEGKSSTYNFEDPNHQ